MGMATLFGLVATVLIASTVQADQFKASNLNQGSHDVNDTVTQERLGRILKKATKGKKKAKSNAPSKRPSKSCYTTAQSADFVTALTNAFSSGVTSVELVICEGETINIPNPIVILIPSSSTSFQNEAHRQLQLTETDYQISIVGAGIESATLNYSGVGLIIGGAISFSTVNLSVNDSVSVNLNSIEMTATNGAVDGFITVPSGTDITLSGNFKVGENVGAPLISDLTKVCPSNPPPN